jgi:hypothetical protein
MGRPTAKDEYEIRARQAAYQSSHKGILLLLLLVRRSLRLNSALCPVRIEVHCILEDGQNLRVS